MNGPVPDRVYAPTKDKFHVAEPYYKKRLSFFSQLDMTAQQHERHRPDRLGVIRTLKRIVQTHDTLQCISFFFFAHRHKASSSSCQH